MMIVMFKEQIVNKLVEQVKASSNQEVKELLKLERDLVSKSVWIIGGGRMGLRYWLRWIRPRNGE